MQNIYAYPNKQFSEICFNRLSKINLISIDLLVLTNVDEANKTIQTRYKYTYPFWVEVTNCDMTTKDIFNVNGHRRYYPEIHIYKDKKYILCNDWYYPNSDKKNIKDTKTPFVQWIEKLEKMR